MSPAGRGPRGKQNTKSGRRSDLVVVGNVEEKCDCPACSGGELDPEQMIAELVDGAADLAGCGDPLEAELAGALFVAMAVAGGDDTVPAFAQALIPAIEARGNDAALMMLTAIGAAASAGPEQVAEAAVAAAGRLAANGVPAPAWARKLEQPLHAGPFTRLYDTEGTMSVLVGSFQRAGHEHAVMVVVDHDDCGAADGILVVDGADLPVALKDLRESGRRDGLTIKTQKLGAPEFRWYVEQAMQARAVHDAENGDDGSQDAPELVDEEDGPGYDVLAVLVRTRLAALPQPRKPKGAVVSGHGAGGRDAMAVLQQLAQMVVRSGDPSDLGLDFLAAGRAQPAKLPAKRKKTAGPPPVYQLKVSLRGAKPPVWRRLVVPGDISLARLHATIGAAFGWHGGHMHVFETAYGDFGRADRELGHREDGSVTLEQVAPEVKDKFRYTYDFGDDWVHDILVEKVLAPDPSTDHPRCTGGKRAAPPDDCGGIWGYQELVEVLADPEHPEHEERLEWLGLADASQFTPDTFDIEEVNRRLRALR
ncbi:plasmid pRiA4b ORF-3 family protein [Micromonospora fulviviridis]|uniref:Plasmid pRiA4b ORF-3 family protein n=2 Tax=Micromonospora fulviviridis TaxID=47860 RepID=A0ABV2VYK8_9ACTN